MDLSLIDQSLIYARGEYATCNGEYKTLMSMAQNFTQQACDSLRHGLQATEYSDMRVHLQNASEIIAKLTQMTHELEELKRQKDDLWNEAWGKK